MGTRAHHLQGWRSYAGGIDDRGAPLPADDDLSSVLSNVCADARPATRRKIANSLETRAFLEIGLLLLHDDLLDHRGPDLLADRDAGTRLFAGLSQARLIERAEQEDVALERPKLLTVGMFRDRWRYKSRYTEDLIAYLMRPALLARKLRLMQSALEALPPDITLADLIREMSRTTLAATLEDPLWGLQTIVWVGLPNHPRVRTFLKANYEQLLTNWAELYQQVAQRYGLELRPGHTWLDVAEMFNAVTDGARMRAKGMGSVAALSTGDNVVVGAIRAMLPALFTNADTALLEGARPR
ncbi:MAG: hypothetical protein JNM77_03600 [Pseudonocardia sp.]|nr:hypothetical protein [Pseudonocardia sp.]